MAAPEGLNKENARKWVKALLSGEYRQTKRVMTRVNGNGEKSHCCLGVGCEVAIEDGVKMEITESRSSYPSPSGFDTILDYDGIGGVPPAAFWDWLGLKDGHYDAHLWVGVVHLPDANDGKGWTFEQIGAHLNNEWDLGLILSEDD